jgi:hypothetical protein
MEELKDTVSENIDFTFDILENMFFYPSGVSGTNGPMIRDSGGVSNAEDSWTVCTSPMRNKEELATPVM